MGGGIEGKNRDPRFSKCRLNADYIIVIIMIMMMMIIIMNIIYYYYYYYIYIYSIICRPCRFGRLCSHLQFHLPFVQDPAPEALWKQMLEAVQVRVLPSPRAPVSWS